MYLITNEYEKLLVIIFFTLKSHNISCKIHGYTLYLPHFSKMGELVMVAYLTFQILKTVDTYNIRFYFLVKDFNTTYTQ